VKRTLFRAVLILTPVLLLLAAEGVLRWIGYGGDLALTVPATLGGRDVIAVNRRLGERYFAGSPVAVPEPTEEYLASPGDTAVRRIVCLGESSMQGFPYEYGATAPGFLEERLAAMFPGERIEVVNLGLSAVGSFVIADLMRDVQELRPDLIVLYMGHNEFYGVYGVGSTVAASSAPWLTRVSLHLLRFRTYLALRNLVLSLRPSGGDAGAQRGTLMEQVAGERSIPYGGELYAQGVQVWRENLERIADEAADARIPLLFCTVVSNLRDQPPFVSLPTPGTGPETARRTAAALAAAGEAQTAEERHRAGELLSGALGEDSLHAGLHYRKGLLYASAGDSIRALMHLVKARDLDALRFRAGTDIRSVLLDVCSTRGIPVARVDAAFARESPGGIPGYSLILEHLHPNLDGYFLMAKEICAAMERSGLVFGADRWRGAARPGDDMLRKQSAATHFDRTMGGIKVHLLMQRWPFREGSGAPVFTPADEFDALVYRYVRGEVPWSDARYAAAGMFARERRFEDARHECRAVARVIPFSYFPLFQEAEYWRMEGRMEEAITAYRRSIAVQENPFARMKIAVIRMEENAPAEAIPEIERALAGGAAPGTRLAAGARSTALYLLGGARAQTGDLTGARTALEECLRLDPSNGDARALLGQVRAAQSAKEGR
jgi:tetratricopeptide (TPR) repeat protein